MRQKVGLVAFSVCNIDNHKSTTWLVTVDNAKSTLFANAMKFVSESHLTHPIQPPYDRAIQRM